VVTGRSIIDGRRLPRLVVAVVVIGARNRSWRRPLIVSVIGFPACRLSAQSGVDEIGMGAGVAIGAAPVRLIVTWAAFAAPAANVGSRYRAAKAVSSMNVAGWLRVASTLIAGLHWPPVTEVDLRWAWAALPHQQTQERRYVCVFIVLSFPLDVERRSYSYGIPPFNHPFLALILGHPVLSSGT
jgi:hypothetical protein